MRPLLDILTDEKSISEEIDAIERALFNPEPRDEKEKLEDRLIDLQMELAEVTDEIRDYFKIIYE